MSKKILVTGSTGLLGRDVYNTFLVDGWSVVGTSLRRADPPSVVKLDLSNDSEIEQTLNEVNPQFIVHCAADRSPDSNNANPEAARALNAKAPATLATLAAARNIFLIYISTDYVFPGIKGEAPYQVDSPTNPPNLYGQNKLEGEKGVLAVSSKDGASSPNVVLRVPVLYGRGDSSDKLEGAVNALVTQIMKAQNLEPGSPSNTVDDWAVRYPTCTSDVARVCRDIATLYTSPENRDKALPRVLQYSAEERFTKWEMCQVFADILGVSLKNMEPSKPDENDSVKRPFDCHLDTKVLKELGINVDCISFRTWWRRDMGAFRK